MVLWLFFMQDTLKVYYLDEVIVTGTPIVSLLREMPVSVSFVSPDDMKGMYFHSTLDALSFTPGVSIEKTGPFGRADVIIRGIGSRGRRIALLVDGRPEKMGIFGCTVTHSFPMNMAERIEVVRGPLSVLYGSDALGGVVNILTGTPDKLFTGLAHLSRGSSGTQDVRVKMGSRVEDVYFILSANLAETDGYLPNSAYEGEDFWGKAGYKKKDWEVSFSAKYFDGYKEEPARVTDTEPSDRWNRYMRGSLDFGVDFPYGNLRVYRTYGEHMFSSGWHSTDRTDGIRFQGKYKFSGNLLVFGGEWKLQAGEIISMGKSFERKTYGGFVYDRWKIWKLSLDAGVRYEVDRSNHVISPYGGIVFHPDDGTRIRLAFSDGYRIPQISELYAFPSSDSTLKPEKLLNAEFGISRKIGGFILDGSLYWMRARDFIALVPQEGFPRYRFENTDPFVYKGAEVGIIYTAGWIKGEAFYSYLDPGERTRGKAKHTLTFSLYAEKRPLGFGINGKYVRDYYADDNGENPLPNYFLVNTRFNFSPFPFLRFFIHVENLLDTDYELYVDIPDAAGVYEMPGRNITVGGEVAF